MTWAELIWLLSIPCIFFASIIIGILIKEEGGAIVGGVMTGLVFIFGALFAGLNNTTDDTNKTTFITSEFETQPAYLNLSNSGLDVITDEYDHYTFKSYEDINRWKNGGKFYKRYYFIKNNFGPDSNKFELLIK